MIAWLRLAQLAHRSEHGAAERDVIAGVDAARMALPGWHRRVDAARMAPPRRAGNQTRSVVEAGTTSLIMMRRTSEASIGHPM